MQFYRTKNKTIMRLHFIAACLLLAATACPEARAQHAKNNPLREAAWLIGTWENKTPKGKLYETWTRANDSMYQGKSYMLRDKDTMVFETMRLVLREGRLCYIPTVADQNSGQPVVFRQNGPGGTDMIFENPEHDFPQRITYKQLSKDALMAAIRGIKDGKERSQQFPMKRVK
jgi:hypothetical protein